ncbi:hypothetical protein JNB62_05320 [Microbacterium jejuense]|uniref:Uncharacterized protein n=1 Tax=Microbacterium jejuense TaxID=1263637 RepID=A0ABS7HK42_9MICO|nr:hypothetical protein [Microbacterium jejuense]MBW9093095.1 hypothetical protein [Microbacterium jejuense]
MENPIAIIVTVVTSVGFGAAVKAIVDGILMARKGISGREDRRKSDIIAQRDHALALQLAAEEGERAADARADAAEAARDRERDKRRIAQESLMEARFQLRERGIDPGPWPDFENTENPNRP